jgi:hypothetical protein
MPVDDSRLGFRFPHRPHVPFAAEKNPPAGAFRDLDMIADPPAEYFL